MLNWLDVVSCKAVQKAITIVQTVGDELAELFFGLTAGSVSELLRQIRGRFCIFEKAFSKLGANSGTSLLIPL